MITSRVPDTKDHMLFTDLKALATEYIRNGMSIQNVAALAAQFLGTCVAMQHMAAQQSHAEINAQARKNIDEGIEAYVVSVEEMLRGKK